MTATRRTLLALVWLIVLIGAGVLISDRLRVSGDLRKFMPGRRSRRRDGEPKAARAADGGQATSAFAGLCGEVRV